MSTGALYAFKLHHLQLLFSVADKNLSSQDLPNYAQQAVPIFSLPQEWLWCESWCGNATKSKAKTIDLCNNPMTKEPKLQVNPGFFQLHNDFVILVSSNLISLFIFGFL